MAYKIWKPSTATRYALRINITKSRSYFACFKIKMRWPKIPKF